MKQENATIKIILSLLLIVIIFSIVFVVEASAQATFTTKTDFTTGASPFDIVCADFNSDGMLDFATCAGTPCVAVHLNTTTPGSLTPTFAPKVEFAATNNPRGIATADFNRDGKPDLVCTNLYGGTVSVFLNTTTPGSSTATFSAKTEITPGTAPWGVIAADFNNDGKPDLAVTNTGGTVGVLFNTTASNAATPTFSARVEFTTGATPYYLCSADINSDGKQDIICGNRDGASMSVFINTTAVNAATPSFSAKTDFTTGNNPYFILAADFNGDGRPDIACASNASGSVSILLNTTVINSAAPTFASKVDFSTGSDPIGIATSDFNNDGRPDLVAANFTNKTITVFLDTTAAGSSTPYLSTKADFTVASNPWGVCTADFNGDRKPDIVCVNGNNGTVSVFINTMTLGVAVPSFDQKVDYSTGSVPWYDILTDVNVDGKQDIVVPNRGGGTLSIFSNNTTPGATTPSYSPKTDFTVGSLPQSVVSADINKDGKPDLLTNNFTSNTVSVLLNTTTPGASTPTYSAKVDFTTGTGPYTVMVADFNLDGKPDFATANQTTNNTSVLLNTTTPGASTPTFSAKTDFNAGTGASCINVSDMNGDGKPDMVVANQTASTISVILNTTTPGGASPTFSAKTDFATGNQPTWVTTSDIDGDGKKDIVFTTTNGVVSVFMNTTTIGSATPTLSSRYDFTVGLGSVCAALGDVNGDGKPDLAVTNFANTSVSILLNTTVSSLSLLTAVPSFSAATDYTTGSGPRGVCIKDVNNDGKQDLIIVNQTSASVSVLLNTAQLPLPVELASFTSIVKGNDVTLNWTTVQEQNNKGFEIERNSFGEGWKKIGYVEGNGTTNHTQNYSYIERGLTTGSYNYRLKQIDYNGNFEYHELTSEVIIGVPSKFSLAQNYPNPFNPSTVVSFQLPVAGFVSLKIFDISGREVSSLVNEVKDAGYYSVNFNAAGISSGTYFYKLTTDKFSDVKKMVVVK